MRRYAIILIVLLSAFVAAGQNNPYSIDDECYKWFSIAEQYVDDFESDTFDEAQRNLLEISLRKKDTKAQNLYYATQLKHTSRLAQRTRRQNIKDHVAWDAAYWNQRMEEERETAQRIAKATGYMQYYYYASDLCQTYYFNTGQDVIAGEMLTAMMQEARETEDEYAMWKSLIYVATLYKRIGDMINTQKYLLEAVKIYENTTDETILRQGMTTQYCDLASTFPVGSESARLYFKKAEDARLTQIDTLKVDYYKAQLAAWDGNAAEYRKLKYSCLSMQNFTFTIVGGDSFFECIDNILRGSSTGSFKNSIDSLYFHQQLDFASRLAAKLGQWETASAALAVYVERLNNDINNINNQRLGQMTAEYENNRLQAELAEASQKVIRKTIWVAVLLGVILLGFLTFSFFHVRALKRAYKKNELLKE